jgi:hypothetical protein
MTSGRFMVITLALSVPWVASCERGPRSRARSIDDLGRLRVGVGPAGTGSAVTSGLLLSPYAAHTPRTLGVAAGQHRGATLYYRESELRR